VFWSVRSCVTNFHLGFPWLLVFQGVCVCTCALVCMRYLCFTGFNSCELCSGGSLIAKGLCVYAPR
jgi:hypothetical protein